MEKMTFESLFKQRNPDHAYLLERMHKALSKEVITFEDITSTNMRSIKEYLAKEVHSSSLKTYMAVISATINEMSDDKLVNKINTKLIGHVKVDKSENIALTEDELCAFVDYYNSLYENNCGSEAERDVLTLFLIECFTGARMSDCKMMSDDNIDGNMLTYVSIKTHTLTKVPVHAMLPTLIKRIPKTKYSRTTHSRILKRVAKSLGINQMETRNYRGELKARPRYEYISTHTARRSFVSLLLDKGVPIASVSKMSGHSSTDMTMRYYCSDKLNLNEEAMAFFKL